MESSAVLPYAALLASAREGIAGVSGLPRGEISLKLHRDLPLLASPCCIGGESKPQERAESLAAQLSKAPASFPPVCGCAPFAEVSAKNGWLLLSPGDGFYREAVNGILCSLPPVLAFPENLLLNRFCRYARHGGTSAPELPSFRFALLRLLAAWEEACSPREAYNACEQLFRGIPAGERARLIRSSGPFFDASARLLNSILLEESHA